VVWNAIALCAAGGRPEEGGEGNWGRGEFGNGKRDVASLHTDACDTELLIKLLNL
jgi:hypothetical protein